ncbi:hypothetical protein PSN45_004641 [Yamadazyma tenuis]|uniref:Uncharacterized protein n=1 Tax=Candida tenuis (strain ATCC 10573 / BCRC 21748 / CBS 615 / JCM 9827 / NBRC 10315 / NRRL Y-1498 / VKM Y-70) TaxID=590646 RepID=G3B738_CANTC|nr:uncharacterized protein CANTEDRAFT_134924 [Yamadazyma tenuis ATCC 10573]EGV63089.1 hypothetical protein CANTEDRAFT_134924 [Yamadazyma tenuis ATCC 10573]WEJ97093.1 hypothetical protein PSN45_004641 [Yamadazyma tenuis]
MRYLSIKTLRDLSISMVATRNQSKQAKKIKFDDEDVSIDLPLGKTEDVEDPAMLSEEENSSEDDSDEGPEEESTNKAKEDLLAQEKARKKAEAEAKREERQRRRQQDLYNKQQQESKKTKQQKLPSIEILPDILPDEILEAINDENVELASETIQPRHKKIEDFDVELKKQLKLEKLKKLKALNKSSIKKGPVHVKVLSSLKGVPRAESKIINSREKWLKRKSLHKK